MKILLSVSDINRYKGYGNKLKQGIGVRRLMKWQIGLRRNAKWVFQLIYLLSILLYMGGRFALTKITEDVKHNYNSDALSVMQNMIEDVVIITRVVLQMVVYKLGSLYDLRWLIREEMM